MSALSAASLLALWEQGSSLPPVRRGLALLAAVFTEEPLDALLDLPVAERDARLLSVREMLFGAQIDGLASCPQCGELVELNFNTRDLIELYQCAPQPATYPLEGPEYRLAYRLPTTRDLLETAGGPLAARRRALAERCVAQAHLGGQAVAPGSLPDDLLAQLNTAMAEVDPLADLWLALTCPVCGAGWQAPFDVVSYLWSELDAWAYRVLQEVHDLAKAYGWSEAAILGLSAWRRRYYLSFL